MAASGWRGFAPDETGESVVIREQWLAFVRNLDWVTAHFGHR
jgi:hypothetical protein